MAALAPSLPGSRIGAYKIVGKLGAGGMGVVYEAVDLKLERRVALKFLGETRPADKERLLREARVASALDHPNIAAVHAVEETNDGRLFIVMTYYEGESLADKLRCGPLDVECAINLACQIARGLEHAHAHGIIHRDIKPSNVMITSDGVAKIVDFGLAHHFGPSESTQSGTLNGTLLYMSPEQVMGKPVDLRTDLWSLGVVLYEMLTGRLPFDGENPAAGIMAIVNSAPASCPELEDGLQVILKRALSKEPTTRYAKCAEMLEDLRRFGGDLRTATIGRGEPLQTSRPKRGGIIAWLPRQVVMLPMASVIVVVVFQLYGHIEAATTKDKHIESPLTTVITKPAEAAPHEFYLKGKKYLERYDVTGNPDAAIAEFEKAVKTDPSFALGFTGLSESYWRKYRLDQNPQWLRLAEGYCRHAARLNDQLPGVHVMFGRILSDSQKELALQEFQRALELGPRNADALGGLAGVYESLGRTQEAEENYQKVVDLRPDYWGGYQDLARFYFGTRQNDMAVAEFRRALELTPDNAQAYSGLGAALLVLGRFDEAESALKKSIELQKSYFAYSNLAIVYYQQKRWEQAAENFEEALKLNRNDYRIWANLGIAYEWLNQREKAEKAYREELAPLQEAARLKPQDAVVQCDLALLYSKQHLRGKAVPLAQKALALAVQDPDVLSCAAEVYENFGDRERALSYIREALVNGLPKADLERNPGLRNLRRDSRFNAIVAENKATPIH
jgi:eukaryotic-like serine/threonine-protein kinase